MPTLIAAACGLILTSGAGASTVSEEEELALAYGDKSTISIATGSQQPLRRAPAVATVITAQDIAAMGATDLDEVLESVPGLHVARSNQAYGSLYVVRGIYSEFNPQTLVLQNGVPMTTLFIGNKANLWVGLPLENVARIEIIRGPGSALYGADAYAGVINIITKAATDIQGTEFGLRAGSFNAVDAWIQHGTRQGDLSAAVYLRAGRTDGHGRRLEADAQTALDGLFGTRASLAPGSMSTGYKAVDAGIDLGWRRWRVRAGYKLRDDIGMAPGVAGALDPVGRGRSERITADLSHADIEVARDTRVGFLTSYQSFSQQFPVPLQLFPPGAFGGSFPNGVFGAPNTWERHWRLALVATHTGFNGHNLRVGIGRDDLDLYRTQELKNFTLSPIGLPQPTPGAVVTEFPVAESFLIPHRRVVNYLYAQDEWSLARDWTITAGIRRDHYSDFGNTTNPRVAVVWDAQLDLTLKLLYGRAFRAPAFTEEYSINNPVIRGNPALRPETISTFEAAMSWQAKPELQLNLSLFRYDMRDIIRAADAGGGTSAFNNVGEQSGSGLELEAAWTPVRSLRFSGNYAFQRSIDESSGTDAGYAPRHHLFMRSDWILDSGLQIGAQANHVAGRRRAAGDLRPPVADYTTVDLTLRSARQTRGWEFTASVRNLFNVDAREPTLAPGSIPYDLPLARRVIYLQAMYRL